MLSEILFYFGYLSSGHPVLTAVRNLQVVPSEADITELLSFRHKCILADDLNAKHPFWNSSVSNPSDEKLLALFDKRIRNFSTPVLHSLVPCGKL
jgi:hypothetical protein